MNDLFYMVPRTGLNAGHLDFKSSALLRQPYGLRVLYFILSPGENDRCATVYNPTELQGHIRTNSDKLWRHPAVHLEMHERESYGLNWCPRTGLNRGPPDYKSGALPAELQGHTPEFIPAN
jgi:hypothetical protein